MGTHPERPVPSHDIKFVFGDLNFRLDVDHAALGCFIARKKSADKVHDFEELLKFDQLWNEYHQFNFLPSLEEEPITFAPTYKFVKGSSEYDTDAKSPAWYSFALIALPRCDRILWATNESVHCLKYASADEVTFSTHRPVYGLFQTDIKLRVLPKPVSKPKLASCPAFPMTVPVGQQEGYEEVKHPSSRNEEPAVHMGTLESFDVVCPSGNRMLRKGVELEVSDSMTSSFVDLGVEKAKPLLEHTFISDYMMSSEEDSAAAASKEPEKANPQEHDEAGG
ncbi:MAG: hypothetical protein P4M11_04005 [Candidatus Pacebacteria bacterium]|nr:hypothetical protein [Candidatus Paceibacterota bacterium]